MDELFHTVRHYCQDNSIKNVSKETNSTADDFPWLNA